MAQSIDEHHRELMHYTTVNGLEGIVTSGCLWATHAAFLNDSDEIHHFIDGPFKKVVFAEVRKFCMEWAANNAQDPHVTEEKTREIAAEFLERWRASIVENLDFFVFSMSRPKTEAVAAHGLLSQWRGYGHDGGYAIVLDAVGLDQLLQVEGKFNLCTLSRGPVEYLDDPNVPEIDDVQRGIAGMLRGEMEDDVAIRFYRAITTLLWQHKHWGFEEECEERIVAAPPKKDVAEYAAKDGDKRQPKLPKTFVRGGLPVPYLELFAGLPCGPYRLPIKRVIVGPHRDQALRIGAVRWLLAANGYTGADVHGSAIPYLGR